MKKIVSLVVVFLIVLQGTMSVFADGEKFDEKDVMHNEFPITETALDKYQEQEWAIDLYNDLVSKFPVSYAGEIMYPDDFGGGYYQDQCLNINIVGKNGEIISNRYLINDEMVIYHTVKYSLAELFLLERAIVDFRIEGVIGLSIDVCENKVVISLDECYANECENFYEKVMSEIEERLDKDSFDWIEDWSDMPILYEETNQAIPCTEIIGGNMLEYYDSSDFGSIGVCGTWKNKPSILTAGHVTAGSSQFTLQGSNSIVGKSVYTNYKDNGYGDWGVVEITNSAATLTNRVNAYEYSTVQIKNALSNGIYLIGTIVTKYGTRTGYAEGTISRIGVVEIYDGYTINGLIEVDLNSEGWIGRGDSGGPVYAGNTIYGLLSAAHIRNISGIDQGIKYYFTPIYLASNYGFTVKTN